MDDDRKTLISNNFQKTAPGSLMSLNLQDFFTSIAQASKTYQYIINDMQHASSKISTGGLGNNQGFWFLYWQNWFFVIPFGINMQSMFDLH